jgi:amidase
MPVERIADMSDLLSHPCHAFMPYPAATVPHAPAGCLQGLSFAVKDLFDLAGYPTSAGQPHVLALSGIKTRNAQTVQTLLDAGAHCMGKTVTDELAYSLMGQNAHFGAPVNPAGAMHVSGGSSSGSASAVGHGLCDFALGTDTGGSVRGPASHCGLWGLRPSHGRVSLQGAVALAPTFDTCGWFARDLTTFRRVGEVLLGADAVGQTRPVRYLLAQEAWQELAPQAHAPLMALCQEVLAAVGQEPVWMSTVMGRLDDMTMAFRTLQAYEAWQVHGDFIRTYAPPLGPGVAQRLQWASTVTEQQYREALAFKADYAQMLTQTLGPDGLLILPTMPDVAPRLDASEAEQESYRGRAFRMLCMAGLAGTPQLSMPLAQVAGMPLGLSLMGPAGSDQRLLAQAQAMWDGLSRLDC